MPYQNSNMVDFKMFFFVWLFFPIVVQINCFLYITVMTVNEFAFCTSINNNLFFSPGPNAWIVFFQRTVITSI